MEKEKRPDPDALLARVREEEHQQTQGKLKVFFGAAAGVGKTYAMLEEARDRLADGTDVVAGWVETHGRSETEALLEGLEILPPRLVDYRGTSLREFDLDGALARRPEVLLLDELAHTNVPGSRHPKRWQDVQELLQAGINVYTTVNVQHLESLNDVVAQITGVIVRETVPDSLIEQADDIELIDLPPDELLERLKEGKVYVPQQAQHAVKNFFRKGNLIALRELALRRTADRVDAQMRLYKRDHAITQTWPTAERLLVCVSPSPSSARVVRGARRMAAALHAEWMAVYVETPSHLRLPEADRNRVIQTLRLAEQLGAEAVTLSGQNASEEIIGYARTRNVSKIVVGKPTQPRWRELLLGSFAYDVVRHCGDIDVYFIRGEEEEEHEPVLRLPEPHHHWWGYMWSALTVALCTIVGLITDHYFETTALAMIYLLGITAVATRYGRRASLLASLLSVAALDFFFVPPYHTFAVVSADYVLTFGIMFVVAFVISNLTARVREQAESARQRERRTAALYSMSRELASILGVNQLLRTAAQHITEVFESSITILVPNEQGHLTVWSEDSSLSPLSAAERGVAQWAYEKRQMAGMGTDTLPGAEALYVPMLASRGVVGVLGVRPLVKERLFSPDQVHLLETFANQTALAIERATLAMERHQAQMQIETERMRNSLLSSVSHDLRTPLASITGATSSLLDSGHQLDSAARQELLLTVYEEAERLNRLVSNLLDMTRIESGSVQLHKEWQALEEVVGAVLTRLHKHLQGRTITTHIPPDLPLVAFDSILIEQVLINLIDNALKYTPPGSPIDVSAWMEGSATEHSTPAMVVEVADRGPGFAPGDEQRIFDKFFRAQSRQSPGDRGVGLGLTICRGIIEAHGGTIQAENRPGGGARFRFTLPLEGAPPVIDEE